MKDMNSNNNKCLTAIFQTENTHYPKPPFGPRQIFPEFTNFTTYPITPGPAENDVYRGVRELFVSLRLDQERLNTTDWNPLQNLIRKGQTVVIKPNLVIDRHPLGAAGVEAMLTHASVVRPIIDYLLLATGGECKIIICDVPLQSANWDNLIHQNGLYALVDFYKNQDIGIELLDLRYEIALVNNEGVYYKSIKKERDPRGYTRIDLGKRSYLQEIINDYKNFEVTDYGKGTVAKHHNPGKNEYLVPASILQADLFINLPKMKTHRKAGVTLSMKNLIGINGDKSWIAHHRRGIDEYPQFKFIEYLKWYVSYYLKIYAPKFLITFIYKMYRMVCLKGQSLKDHGMRHGACLMEGNWHGNDTVWRTILDLNNIIFFADKKGTIKCEQQRKYLSIIDGIIGMDQEGPMEGYPKKTGILTGGFHPVAVDYVTNYIMGYDYKKIPTIKNGFNEKFYNLTNFAPKDIVVSSDQEWQNINLQFAPTKGWIRKIER